MECIRTDGVFGILEVQSCKMAKKNGISHRYHIRGRWWGMDLEKSWDQDR